MSWLLRFWAAKFHQFFSLLDKLKVTKNIETLIIMLTKALTIVCNCLKNGFFGEKGIVLVFLLCFFCLNFMVLHTGSFVVLYV